MSDGTNQAQPPPDNMDPHCSGMSEGTNQEQPPPENMAPHSFISEATNQEQPPPEIMDPHCSGISENTNQTQPPPENTDPLSCGMPEGTSQAQPPPENVANPVELKRKRAVPDDDWLPPGWTTTERVRTSGVKVGMVDKFYFEPVTMRKFRSRNEVLYYLENGTPKKPTKKSENSPFQSEQSEGRGSSKRQRKSNKKANKPQPPPPKPLDFDFLNVPEKVTWTGKTGSGEAWCAFIGEYKIQESVSHEWDRAFTVITSQDDGKPTVVNID